MSAALDFLCGSVASVFAVCFTNPMDMMRTRMQLQGDLCRHGEYERLYHNLVQGMCRVAREEGVGALQKGLGASILWQITQNGLRIGLYPTLKQSADSMVLFSKQKLFRHSVAAPTSSGEQAGLVGQEAFISCMVAGAASGGIGAFVSSPFSLVKVRLQSQRTPREMEMVARMGGGEAGIKSTGVQYEYRGVCHALGSLYCHGGIRGLWHGSRTGAKLVMGGSAIQLVAYDFSSRFIIAQWGSCFGSADASTAATLKKDPRVHFSAALLSATILVFIMNPFNLVTIRSYNHERGAGAMYSGQTMTASVLQVYRHEGVSGCYKGSVAFLARVAPHVTITFVTYEWLRRRVEDWKGNQSV